MGVLEHCNVTRYGMRGAVVGILPLNDCFEFLGLSPLARFGLRSGCICERRVARPVGKLKRLDAENKAYSPVQQCATMPPAVKMSPSETRAGFASAAQLCT